MPIERLRVRDLVPQERADLESALADPGRFRPEDRKTLVLGLIGSAWVLFLAEVAIMLECNRCPWEFGDALQLFEGFFGSLPWSLQFLWHPTVLPFVASNVVLAAIVAVLAMVVRTWLSRKRQGHALASFGVVHGRGNSLRLLRYARIAQVRGAESVHDALEVLDAAGERLVVPGAAQWKPLIEERRSAVRSSEDPAKR
jgi:hypothetical protein